MNGLGRIAVAAACVAVPNLAYAKSAPSCPLPAFGPGSSYHPAIHPSGFSANVTNRWFPLRPGTTYLYTGTKDGKKALDVVQVSATTKKIDGVVTRVADDYLVKPFDLAELVARLHALFRRGPAPRPATLRVGDLSLDPAEREVRRGQHPIELTAREFSLLEYFMRHPSESLSRTRLVQHVWDDAFDGDPHVVSVYVSYLRDKIDRPFGRSSLQTVRGAGYRLRDDLAATPAN